MATTTVDPSAVVLEVLTQFSYKRWSLGVQNYLLSKGLWHVVVTQPPKQKESDPEFKTWRRDNARALLVIQGCCGTYNSQFISEDTNAKDAWERLAKLFKPIYYEITEDPSYDRDVAIDDNMGHLSDKQVSVPNDDRQLKEIRDIKSNVNENENYKGFFSNVMKGKWDTVLPFLDKNPCAIRIKISKKECTVLHIAVLKRENKNTVEKMMKLVTEEDLEIRDKSGLTAFHLAVKKNNFTMVKWMVEKNKKLPCIGFPGDEMLPVLWSYAARSRKMASYLYDKTPLTALKSSSGAELITQSLLGNKISPSGDKKEDAVKGRSGADSRSLPGSADPWSLHERKYEIGWDLIQRCPSLALAIDFFGHSPLNALAGMHCAFLSGKPLDFWEQWIYDSIYVESTLTMSSEIDQHPDVRINVCEEETNLTGMRSFRQRATSLLRCLFPGMDTAFVKFLHNHQFFSKVMQFYIDFNVNTGQYDRIYQMKSSHVRCKEFLHIMSGVANNKNLEEMQVMFVQTAIFRAVEQGHTEFVKHFLEVYPECTEMIDARGTNMFQYAVECRQENIYNILYGLKKRKKLVNVLDGSDNSKNSALHLVGRLPSSGQLDRIKDATLRMQRELQWFEQLESILPASVGDLVNITDNMTPRELFTKTHNNLKKDAEEAMKHTATSCSVVSALIVTMMFAAAFTVPGGKNEETEGKQLYKTRVMVYLVSVAISFCSSSTSVIIFLAVLTSRYAEVDFLRKLPTKMIFGLLNLFLAVTSMMIAFYCVIYMMVERNSGTGIPVIVTCAIPVISFALMHFGLLKGLISGTLGKGIFRKPVEPLDLKF